MNLLLNVSFVDWSLLSKKPVSVSSLQVTHLTVTFTFLFFSSASSANFQMRNHLQLQCPTPVRRLVCLMVRPSVGHIFRCTLFWCLWTVTERQQNTGCVICSESYDQQLSDFNFPKVYFPNFFPICIFQTVFSQTVFFQTTFGNCISTNCIV